MVQSGAITRPCPQWGDMTSASLLTKWAKNKADTVFLSSADGQTHTYGDAHGEVRNLSLALLGFGFRPGDCVLIRAGRRVDGLLLLLAATQIGLDVCLVPESMSARQASEGAVAFAPKVAVETGQISPDAGDELRILEMAANLFTIRIVGCFGPPPDGFVDMSELAELNALDHEGEKPGEAEDSSPWPAFDASLHGKVHSLHINASGKVERRSRTQAQLLSQALASAMMAGLAPKSTVGTAYDPLSPTGLLAAALPALLVGAQLQQFDALDPHMASRQHDWLEASSLRSVVVPAELAAKAAVLKPQAGKRLWISNGPLSQTLPDGEAMLVNCDGMALLPASQNSEGQTCVRPGAITVTPKHGAAIMFGTVQLDGGPQENSSAGSLMNGTLSLSSPLAASQDGTPRDPQRTKQQAKPVEDASGRPVYALQDGDQNTVRVGTQLVSLAVINRALGLTGRWQDAGAFAVQDSMLHHRIEVAVEPRASEESDTPLPTLEMVRTMLRDSGINDAGLPCKLHLVTRVPRRSAGLVDQAQLADHALEPVVEAASEEPIAETSISQAVA